MPDKERISVLPLRGVLVFPNMVLHLDVGREKSISSLERAMMQDNRILLISQKDAGVDDPTQDEIYEVGTVAQVKQMIKLPGGTIRVLVEGMNRARVLELFTEELYLEAEVEVVEDSTEVTPQIEARMRSLLHQFEQYIKASRKVPPETLNTVSDIAEPGRFADVIASHLSMDIAKRQEVLEAIDVNDRLEKIYEETVKEMEILEIERKINMRVRKQMEKTQKEYYLREQMKAIQQELGEKDERTAEAEEYRERLAEVELPEEVEEKVLKEIDRLEKMPPQAGELTVIRNYIDWLISLPWKVETEDCLDLDQAEKILDEDHYGLEKVKERIIEYLAVRQLAKQLKGPVLCLIGPPGVGKTSLAKSVARALERNFVRISLGGVRDEAEIRGHRRTYVGALPGRIIQGMRQAGSNNPIFLMDEIDKMSTDFRGDPSAALLEVLDPEQCSNFSDHYVELAYDLSQVMFITTGNISHKIPQPLQDRMEVIHIPGYTEEEKVKIASNHLIPKQLKEHGLTGDNLVISENGIRRIVREYTREAGVRNLDRNISAICRKTAREVAKNRETQIHINRQNIPKYVGVPRYRYGVAEKQDQIGVATGLGWTESGGDLLSIEVTQLKGTGKMTLTGQMGDVMQESAKAAMSYIRSRAESLGLEKDFYEKVDIHIHVPEGAIPKDGPSAGIAMATALVSALAKMPVRNDVTMTGEITLRGRVLPVGGVKEKMMAAHRAGIKYMLMPAENRRDLSDIPKNVKRKVEVKMVEHMDEVLEYALVKPESSISAESESRKAKENDLNLPEGTQESQVRH